MNMKKILASIAAGAAAASVMSVASFANATISGDLGGNIVEIGDDGATWKFNLGAEGVLDENVKIGDIYGVTITLTQATHDAYVSGAAGMGGAVAFSGSGSDRGWNSVEWGNDSAGKPITYVDDTRTITRLENTPFFNETDISGEPNTQAYVCLQGYWGPDALEVEALSLLGRDGAVLKTFPNDGAGDGETDETTSETEAPAQTEASITTEAPTTTEAPAETTSAPAASDTTANNNDKNSANTGVEGIAAAVGMAIVAAGAVAVAKRRG